MNVIYVCRVSKFQASGNQIDIPKKVAISFFGFPLENIQNSKNTSITVCHRSDVRSFESIEIQPATNMRLSTKFNQFLKNNGDKLTEGDLLVFEKLGRCYCVYTLSKGDKKYDALWDLFEEEEKHMLLSSSIQTQPQETEKIKPSYRPYITAIKSKPFLLLAGISGTGKSRIVRELARACWEEGGDEYVAQKPRNFEIVQVKPNWHDSSELLGYVSRIGADKEGNGISFVTGDFLKFIARAWEEPEVPYFLCLDEMNLAPVEQYFAEYLSVIESRKASNDGTITTDPILKLQAQQWYYDLVNELTNTEEVKIRFLNDGICIPKNLIVVGTVNMDETTFSFSRKVLDRAMTIEMNEVDLYGGLTNRYEQIGKLSSEHLIGNAVEGVDIYESNKEVCDLVINYLQNINNTLEGTPFKIAYRTRNEFLLYVVNNLPYNKDVSGEELSSGFVIARALDEITNMKILSRIEGDETKVTAKFLTDIENAIQDGLKAVSNESFATEETDEAHKSVSLAKLNEMKARLVSGYTSFWS